MKAIFVLLLLLVFLVAVSGCTQQPPAPSGGDQLGSDTVGISNGLDDLADLQNSLDDTALEDSGIDENSFI